MLEPLPRLPVTDQGVFIPKTWFGSAREVALTKQINGQIVLMPLGAGNEESAVDAETGCAEESIWDLGSDPIADDRITDGSVNLDKYLYGAP